MFDKLSKLFESQPEREFKPRPQGLREKISTPVEQQIQARGKNESIDKGVLIGADPFNRKSDLGSQERIQGKLELLRQLQKELGKHG